MKCIQGSKRRIKKTDPTSGQSPMIILHGNYRKKICVQMRLKFGENTIGIRHIHLLAPNLSGDCGVKFHFRQKTQGGFNLPADITLNLVAKNFRAVIGGEHACVNIDRQ